MTKVNPNNANETKTAIFPWDVFKSDVIYFFFFQKILKFLSFTTKVNANNGNKTKSDIFYGTYSNLTSFFIGHKILKYFNNFCN